MPAVGLAANRMNKRTVSAPYCSIIASGETVLPSDLLIFALRSPKASPHCAHGAPAADTGKVTAHESHQGAALLTIPWQSRLWKGSSML